MPQDSLLEDLLFSSIHSLLYPVQTGCHSIVRNRYCFFNFRIALYIKLLKPFIFELHMGNIDSVIGLSKEVRCVPRRIPSGTPGRSNQLV